jgi:hypothetical protein
MSNIFKKSMEKLREKLNKKKIEHYETKNYDVVEDFAKISEISIESLDTASEKLTDEECKKAIKKVLYSKSSNSQMIDFIYQNEKFKKNLDEEDECYMVLKLEKIREIDSKTNNVSDGDPISYLHVFEEGGAYHHLNQKTDFIEKCKKIEELTSEDLIRNNEFLIRDLNYWRLTLQEKLIDLNYDRMNIIDSTKEKIIPRLLKQDDSIDNSLDLKYKEDTIWGSKIYKKDENNNRIPILEISFFRKEVRMTNMPDFGEEEDRKVYDTMALAARSKGIAKPVINVAEQLAEDRETFVRETIKSLIGVGKYKIEDIMVPNDCQSVKQEFLDNLQGLSENLNSNNEDTVEKSVETPENPEIQKNVFSGNERALDKSALNSETSESLDLGALSRDENVDNKGGKPATSTKKIINFQEIANESANELEVEGKLSNQEFRYSDVDKSEFDIQSSEDGPSDFNDYDIDMLKSFNLEESTVKENPLNKKVNKEQLTKDITSKLKKRQELKPQSPK